MATQPTTNDSTTIRDAPSFNLWSEEWLPVEMLDGSVQRHSIREALLHAHERRAIQDPSPLVIVGVHRLLTAILQDALNPQANDDLNELWRARRFPEDKIVAFGTSYADRFDLFSPDKPFLQSADLPMFPKTNEEEKEKTSVARLFIETPSGTGVTHYNHHLEDESVLSSQIAVLGLLTIPPFASSGARGGGGYYLLPSINGVPPIYILPSGASLFEQLAASLLASNNGYEPMAPDDGDLVWWRRAVPTVLVSSKSKKKTPSMGLAESKQLSVAGYLHGMTFPARKIRLHPELLNTTCSRSGEATAWAVRTMAFRMGESLLDDAPLWRDPFVAYKLPIPPKTGRAGKATTKKIDKPKPIRPTVNKGRAAWREFSGLFLRRSDASRTTERPRFLDQLSRLDIGNVREVHPFRCVALQTDGKMKFFEWVDFGFDVPPSLLRDPDGARWTDDALAFASGCADRITHVFTRVFSGNSKKAARFNRQKANMEADFWQVTGETFRGYVIDLGDEAKREARLNDWFDETKRQAQCAFDRAANATGDDGNTLRLIEEGKARCRIALAALRNQTNQSADAVGATDDTNKRKAAKTAKRPRR